MSLLLLFPSVGPVSLVAHPTDTLVSGSWSAVNAATLHESIDEAETDDADYMASSGESLDAAEIDFGQLTEPAGGASTVTRVQTSSEVVVAGTSGSVTLNGVGAGNLLVITLTQGASAIRTYTPSDDQSNTWQQAVHINPGRAAGIWYAQNVAGGNTQVTVTANASTNFNFFVTEVSGADTTAALDQTSSLEEIVNTNNHFSSASADVIDTAAGVIVFTAGTLNVSSGISDVSPGAGYTSLGASSLQFLHQFKTSASALVNERGPWAHGGTARLGLSAIASFKGAASGSGPVSLIIRFRRGT